MDLQRRIRNAILAVAGKNEECKDGVHCPTRIHSSAAPGAAVLPAFAVPVNIGVANAPGVAATIVRSDHVHNHPAGLGFALHHDHYRRYIEPHLYCCPPVTDSKVANRVYYRPIDIPFTMTIDGIITVHNQPAGNGNMYVAFYDSTNEAPVNRLAVSAAAATAGFALDKHFVPFINTVQVAPGYYFLAFEVDNAIDVFHAGVFQSPETDPAGVANGPSFYWEDAGPPPPAVATPIQVVFTREDTLAQILRVASIP